MLGLLTVLLGGCGAPVPPEQPNPPPEPLTVFSETTVQGSELELAITVAAALQRAPERHGEVLLEHGLTSERWETILVNVASDPEASQAYAAALDAAASTAPAEPSPSP